MKQAQGGLQSARRFKKVFPLKAGTKRMGSYAKAPEELFTNKKSTPV